MYSGSLLEKMYSTRVCGGGRSSSTGVSLCAHHVLLNTPLESLPLPLPCTHAFCENGGCSHCCHIPLPAGVYTTPTYFLIITGPDSPTSRQS